MRGSEAAAAILAAVASNNIGKAVIGAVVGGYLVNAGLLKLPYDFDAFIPYGNQIVVSTVGALLVVIIARFLVGR